MSSSASSFSRQTSGHALRPDLALITEWVLPGSRILDLGCGDGTLLAHLNRHRKASGYGLEIDPDNVARCIEHGVNVIQTDVDDGLAEFADGSFDYVVMTQALQALVRPDQVLAEMMRVGREVIVTFPNFGHWRARAQLITGRMPLTPSLPAPWYSTPNIHLCTVDDFEALCQQMRWQVLERALFDHRLRRSNAINRAPNLFCELALYKLQRPRK